MDKELTYQPRCYAQDATAFVMCATGETVSFGQLESRANQGAHLLRKNQINTGDHIAILMENRREFLEVCFAADRAGIYYTTISTHLTFDEISYILSDCAATMLIGSDAHLDTLKKLHKAHGNSCDFYLVGAPCKGMKDWAGSIAAMPESPIPDEAQGLDMLYSSGTTGRPKGIKWPLDPIPPGSRTMLIDLLASLFGYTKGTRYLSPAPLYLSLIHI